MPVIDSRLLDCDREPEYTENFNRVLNLVDANSNLHRIADAPEVA